MKQETHVKTLMNVHWEKHVQAILIVAIVLARLAVNVDQAFHLFLICFCLVLTQTSVNRLVFVITNVLIHTVHISVLAMRVINWAQIDVLALVIIFYI